MKKVSAMTVVSLLVSLCVALPALATPTQQQQKQFKSDAEREAYTAFYNEKTDASKKLALGKDFLKKFPESEFASSVKSVNFQLLDYMFKQHLGAFYQGRPDAAKLEPLLAVGNEILSEQPEQAFYVGHLALATGFGVLAQFYKDTDKSKAYAEKALQLLEPTAPPKDWAPLTPEMWNALRTDGLSKLNQYMGLYLLNQATPDPEQAITYLNKAAGNKAWGTAKDPVTYLLRAQANTTFYTKLNAEYSSLSPDEKTGDKGKEILAKVDPVVDKLIDDYARVVALSNKPEAKAQLDDAKERLTDFWKYRHNGKLDGMTELIKYYEADPTAPPPTKPAVSEPVPTAQPGRRGESSL